MLKEYYKIVNGSMGSFLCSPYYPSYYYHIKSKNCSIAIIKKVYKSKEYSYIPDSIKTKVKEMIEDWYKNRPSLDHPLVKDWIYQILGYFNSCWKLTESSNVSDLHYKNYRTLFDTDEEYYFFLTKVQFLHAGINYIKKYYPEYKAIKEDFKKAYWGKEKLFTGKEKRVMKIKIKDSAPSIYLSSNIYVPYNEKFYNILKVIAGKKIEVETDYLFLDQFNTVLHSPRLHAFLFDLCY